MADLDWTTETSTPAQVKKELLHEKTISEGQGIEYKCVDDFNEPVPTGKQWTVVTSIRIIETDV